MTLKTFIIITAIIFGTLFGAIIYHDYKHRNCKCTKYEWQFVGGKFWGNMCVEMEHHH